jgi:hypothetical protein
MRAISALEALEQGATVNPVELARSRRGRKSMNSEERREVSLRMKKYWASRRVGVSAAEDGAQQSHFPIQE